MCYRIVLPSLPALSRKDGGIGDEMEHGTEHSQAASPALIPQAEVLEFGQAVCILDRAQRVVIRIKRSEIWERGCIQGL